MKVLTFPEAHHQQVKLTAAAADGSTRFVSATSINFVRPSKDGGAEYLSNGYENEAEVPSLHHVKETVANVVEQLHAAGLPTLEFMGVYLTPQGAELVKTAPWIRREHNFADPASQDNLSPLTVVNRGKIIKFLGDYTNEANKNVLTISLGGNLEVVADFIGYAKSILPSSAKVISPREHGKVTARFPSIKEGEQWIQALRNDRPRESHVMAVGNGSN